MADKGSTPEQFARAFRLIGEFMYHWAALERALNSGVAQLLQIDSALDQAILTTNMSVREKLNVLRTRLILSHTKDGPEWKRLNKLIDRIGDRNDDRNIVAHTSFAPHPKGVLFYQIKAKGQFSIPDLVWSESEFDVRMEKMSALKEQLSEAVATARRRRDAKRPRNALGGLMGSPMTGTGGQGLLGYLENLPPTDPDSAQTNPETSPQSDPEPRE